MKPKRDHYYQEKQGMAATEARAFASLLVWGSLIAILVLSDRHFGIFLVTAFAAMVATGCIWSGETGTNSDRDLSKDAQAALQLLELLEDDELEKLKARLKANLQNEQREYPHEEDIIIGQQILIQ